MRPDSLDNLTEEAFDAWEAFDPPEGFAARVVAEAARREATVPLADEVAAPRGASPWRWRGLVVGVAVAAVAAAAAAVALFSGGDGAREPGVSSALAPDDGGVPNVGLDPKKAGDADPGFKAKPLPLDLSARIDDYVGAHGRRYGEVFRFHGTIIVARDGDVVFRKSYGDAVRGDGEAASVAHSPDTRHRIGTLSQQITATAVMLLVERGELSLDDTIHKHLPDYPEVGRGITIRQLLDHTSGIPSFTDDLSLLEWRGQPHTTASLVARFSGEPLEHAPGEEFDPSNSGYALLGAIVEAVRGEPFGVFARREIFAPLGMERTTIGDPAGVLVAPGHLFSEDEQLTRFAPEKIDLSAFGAAGNVVTTADDLSRWAVALFEGRLLKPETVAAMIETTNDDGYALGWIPETEFGQGVVGHPGGVEGFNAAIRYYRGDRTLILAIANNDVIDARAVVEELGQITHGRRATPPIEREEIAAARERFDLYTGYYVLTDESRTELERFFDAEEVARIEHAQVMIDDDRLFFWVPGHGMKWMHGLDDDTFFFKDAAATVATFQFPHRAGEHRVAPGEPRSDSAPAEGDVKVDPDAPASALLLRQGPIDIRMRRATGADRNPVLPSL
ncbi:MAG: serine hydrolase domain-containing protein [Nannocystaceae bacterium]